MRVHRLSPVLLLILLSGLSATLAAQPSVGRVRGEVTDLSGAVLPGVTIIATHADGRVLATTNSDRVGRFDLSLPLADVALGFSLDGFETGVLKLTVTADTTVAQRLKLAAVTEQVIVYGAPAPAAMPLPDNAPALARRTLLPVRAEVLETICTPARADVASAPVAVIRGHRDDRGRSLFAKGEELLIAGGSAQGLEVGRNFLATRRFATGRTPLSAPGEHTSGLVQIVDVSADAAVAVVVHACSELTPGDTLSWFTPALVQPAAARATPVFDDAARILFADAGQLLAAPGRYLVIDHGADHGLVAGHRMTLFRRRQAHPEPLVLGDAIVIAVRRESATIRVERLSGVVEFGDFAAPQGERQ